MQTSQIPGGIQPHSMGSLFPAVIARIDRSCRSLIVQSGRLTVYERYTISSWELTLGDFCEEYATREDAEAAARGLLDGVARRDTRCLEAVGLGAVVVEMTQRRFLRAEEC